MRIPCALALLLIVLTGCTPAFDVSGTEWAKAGALFPQVTLDETECARKAFEAGSTPDLLLGGMLDWGRLMVENGVQANTYSDCMTNLGYERKDG
ncbi:MAG TPA: hypothetical protein VID04_07175 [Methylomirabilota bacterium]|jgi:hypothetical protein